MRKIPKTIDSRNVTAFHGGGFWETLDYDLSRISELGTEIIPADVLDAWYPPTTKVTEALQKDLEKIIRTCPPAQPIGMIRAIAKSRGIPEKNVICGTGSSQLIFLLLQHLLKKDDSVMVLDPMYGEYRFVAEQIIGAKVIPYFLNLEHSFAISIPEFASEIVKLKPSAVVLVNPNSPTGTCLRRSQVEELLSIIPRSTIVIVDETYIEYIRADESCEKLASTTSRLCVIKSLSKIYALSGLRAGYLVAHESLIKRLGTQIPPWSVSALAQIATTEALNDEVYYQIRIAETKELAKKMFQDLQSVSFLEPFPTVTNFILCRLEGVKASSVIAKLKKENIFVRNCDSMSEQFHDDHIRITVLDQRQNSIIVKVLTHLL